jgi:hypothetical protein
MKKKIFSYITVFSGLILFILGLVLLKSIDNPQGILLVLPYICIGLGCGAFGHGLGDIVNSRVTKNNPRLKKQMEIEKNDERNIAVANKAKAKAYDIMLYIFAALMIAFALMGIDLAPILLLVAAYLFVVGFFIFYLNKYNKEM